MAKIESQFNKRQSWQTVSLSRAGQSPKHVMMIKHAPTFLNSLMVSTKQLQLESRKTCWSNTARNCLHTNKNVVPILKLNRITYFNSSPTWFWFKAAWKRIFFCRKWVEAHTEFCQLTVEGKRGSDDFAFSSKVTRLSWKLSTHSERIWNKFL